MKVGNAPGKIWEWIGVETAVGRSYSLESVIEEHGEIMKILIITDLEGVNGVLNFSDWCVPEGNRNEISCRFLTEEVNTAIKGFFDGGADDILVWDGHGPGGSIRGEILDERVFLQRGAVDWPVLSSDNYDAIAFVGQHAKAGSPKSHLSHTQTGDAVDFRINSISIGEYGQMAFSAWEAGAKTIFVSGDRAMALESAALTPEVVAVAVKTGLKDAPPGDTPADKVFAHVDAAVHFPRKQVMKQLYEGALAAVKKFKANPDVFTLPELAPPFVAEAEYRAIGSELAPRFGNLPARHIKTRPHASITGAIREFYSEIEWIMPDGERVVEI
jgi:D-aminopeptidase